jgi:hypothetical protein
MAGCTTGLGASIDPSVQFAQEPPPAISAAWRQGDSVWMVPARGVLIEAVYDDNASRVMLLSEGSYLRLRSSSHRFLIKTPGAEYSLAVP